MALIDAYDTRTGEARQVPEHWIGHPTLGAGFSLTPPEPATPVVEITSAGFVDVTDVALGSPQVRKGGKTATTEQPATPVVDENKEH